MIIKLIVTWLLVWLIFSTSAAQANWFPFIQEKPSEYYQLGKALAAYNAMAKQGEWIQIPSGPILRPGVHDPRISLVRLRLTQQDLITNAGSSTFYDNDLLNIVLKFEAMHGLKQDGLIGKNVIDALNVPLAMRIKQISLNMERWHNVPDDLGERHININIPDFELQAIDHDKPVLEMRVIIGKSVKQTPIFSSIITDVIFHPYWHVPNSIAREKLATIQQDPSYLKLHNFKVFDSGGGVINPDAVQWNAISKWHFPYRLRQEPGDMNALGKIRFSIQGDQDIYMHGTPEQKLFAKNLRAESSGCIRVENPLELAYFVLQDMPHWPASRIENIYNNKPITTKAVLPKPLPIHILYMTSWVDKNGQIQFRDDIYGLDK